MITRKPTFAVLGTGNSGQTYAADIILKGYSVNLAEVPAFADNLTAIKKVGGIALSGEAGSGFACPNMITTDLGEAIRRVDVPFGLATWSALGRLWGVKTPQIDAVLTIASTMPGRDCFAEAFYPDDVGIGDLPQEAHCAYVE